MSHSGRGFPWKTVLTSLAAVEKGSCNHATCVAGDVYGDGRTDLVTGNFGFTRDATAVTVWRNRGRAVTVASRR